MTLASASNADSAGPPHGPPRTGSKSESQMTTTLPAEAEPAPGLTSVASFISSLGSRRRPPRTSG